MKLTKRTLLTAGVLLLVAGIGAAPALALNAIVKDDVASYTSTSGNIYTAGNNVYVKDPTPGDVLAAAGSIQLDGNIGRSVRAAGGEVLVNSNVTGDLVVAAGSTIINGDVHGDVMVVGGEVFVNSAHIDGNLIVMAGNVSIAKGVVVTGEQHLNEGVRVTNASMSAINLNATDNPKDFTVYKPVWTDFSNLGTQKSRVLIGLATVLAAAGVVLGILLLIGTIIAGIVVIKLFPVFTAKTVNTMETKFMVSVATGIVTMILAVVVGMVLLFSVVGIPLLLVLGLLGAVAFMLAGIYSRLVLAKVVLNDILNIKTKNAMVLFTVGYLMIFALSFLLSLIPFFGSLMNGIISCVMVSWGLGAIVYNKYQSMNGKRK